MVRIIKASGAKVVFNKKRIEETSMKAGASREFARKVSDKVAAKVKENMSTQKILNITLKFLEKKPEVAARYDLKRAIMMLGPDGFAFEEYIAQILQNYGYKTKTDIHIKGKKVFQEVDIFAINKLNYMIETKYHNQIGIYTDTKVAMYTYARFLDIKSNPKNKIDKAWLITNTRCTHNAVDYAKGVGLKVTGWAYPKEEPLQKFIEYKALYPITIFKNLKDSVKEKLFRAKIVLAKDLVNHDLKELSNKTGLNKKELNYLLAEAKKILRLQ